MKFLVLTFLFVSIHGILIAQDTSAYFNKPVIDSSLYGKWPFISNLKISDDGKYIIYTLNNSPTAGSTLILRSTTTNWIKKIIGASANEAIITENSQKVFVLNSTNALISVILGTDNIDSIVNVQSYLIGKDGIGSWLAYQLKDSTGTLNLVNLFSRNKMAFKNAAQFEFSDSTHILITVKVLNNNITGLTSSLKWVNLENGDQRKIWSGNSPQKEPGNYTFDASGSKLAFLVKEKSDSDATYTLWYYDEGMKEAICQVNMQKQKTLLDYSLANSSPSFNKDGSRIYFNLKKRVPSSKPSSYKSVDVWSYKDELLPSQVITENKDVNYLATINRSDKSIVVLTTAEDHTPDYSLLKESSNYVLVRNETDGIAEFLKPKRCYWLESAKDGTRKLIDDHFQSTQSVIEVSPDEKYILYYDELKKRCISYRILNGEKNVIGQDIADSIKHGKALFYRQIYFSNVWFPKDSAVLFYDRYDIWRVDPMGIKPSINLTNHFGEKHNIFFHLASDSRGVITSKLILLSALNMTNKYSGFYSLKLDSLEDPKFLTMGPFTYSLPIAANKADSTFVIERESFDEAPNFFLTRNFTTYTPLSDNQPQKKYNWMTAELVKWKMLDGDSSSGILYKPTNFNPHKKYPLIFSIYEVLSHTIYNFLTPHWSDGEMDIPTFVSNGYLVFEPDIFYKVGRTGESALNSVESAAKYLSKFTFVDSTKMGIQGLSFGAYEVNYIITHSHIFFAAVSASGMSDLVSGYGGLFGSVYGGKSMQEIHETGQLRIGTTLWQRPDLYVANSPVFKADEVTTPLLLMNNRDDYAVPWTQGIEFFLGLRRLAKPVWLLQYDDGSHAVSGESSKDFTIRMQQFFDYYLKGTKPPKWMTEGAIDYKHEVNTGLELDSSDTIP